MRQGIGADSGVGFLRTVLVHRPGAELARITPGTTSRLRFDRVPWLARARQEHDALTDVLRSHGADVLHVTELLQDVLEYSSARRELIGSVTSGARLGDELELTVREHLESLQPEDLAEALIAGLEPAELRCGRGLVYDLLGPHDFVIEPLPNLVFSADSSLWIGDQLVITGLPGSRARENALLSAIYRHHPRFCGIKAPYLAGSDRLDGADVLLLAPGVVAVGVGARTTPAGVERLAGHLLRTGAAQAVLAVPMDQRRRAGRLSLACTVVDSGAVLMVPALAFTLTAISITVRNDSLAVSRPRPFLEAVARAIGIAKLTVIDTGIDPRYRPGLPGLAGLAGLPSPASQWDDGASALATGHRVMICDERNVATNERLSAAGYDVVTVPAGELGSLSGRGGRRGPRCMCTPVRRDPAPACAPADRGDQAAALAALAGAASRHAGSPAVLAKAPEPRPRQDAAPVGLFPGPGSAARPATEPEHAEHEHCG